MRKLVRHLFTGTSSASVRRPFVPFLEMLEDRQLPSAAAPALWLTQPVSARVWEPVAMLSVAAAEAGGGGLTYRWTASDPSVTFIANGTGTANDTYAVVTHGDTYQFTVTVTDAAGRAVSGSLSVYVPYPAFSSYFTASGGTQVWPFFTPLPQGGAWFPVGGGGSAPPVQFAKGKQLAARQADDGEPVTSSGGSNATPASGQANAITVRLEGAFNQVGIGGPSFTGLDGPMIPAESLDRLVVWDDQTFVLGSANRANVVRAEGQVIDLPRGNFAALAFLAVAVGDGQPDATFTVTYADGTEERFTQAFSGCRRPRGHIGETQVARVALAGGSETGHIYGYRFALDRTKAVRSVRLPSGGCLRILAMNVLHRRPASLIEVEAPTVPALRPPVSAANRPRPGRAAPAAVVWDYPVNESDSLDVSAARLVPPLAADSIVAPASLFLLWMVPALGALPIRWGVSGDARSASIQQSTVVPSEKTSR